MGEILRGDRISTTAYDVEMNVGYDCRVLCGSTDSPSKFDESQSSTLHYRITQEYFIHMIIGKYTHDWVGKSWNFALKTSSLSCLVT